jgi:hypothetical protein
MLGTLLCSKTRCRAWLYKPQDGRKAYGGAAVYQGGHGEATALDETGKDHTLFNVVEKGLIGLIGKT